MDNKKNITVRQSNFELMRIISMFMIVLWHVIFHTNMFYNTSGTTGYIIEFIYLIIIVHVNSYVLVTGYFQYNKKIKPKKIWGLIGSVWFYNILFTFIAMAFKLQKINKVEFLENTSILNINSYWFINYYIILYVLSPFLNKMIFSLKQSEHRRLILILYVAFSIIPTITKQRTLENTGLSIISFIFLYLLGAYFGKYKIKDSYHFKRNSNIKNGTIFFSLFLLFGIIGFVFYRFGLDLIKSDNIILNDFGQTITMSATTFSAPIIILESVFYFLFFETISIQSNFIGKISKFMFGVYLVHENYYVCNNIYKIKQLNLYSNEPIVIIRAILTSIVIFFISIIIEMIRKFISKLIFNRKAMKKLEQKYDKIVKEF